MATYKAPQSAYGQMLGEFFDKSTGVSIGAFLILKHAIDNENTAIGVSLGACVALFGWAVAYSQYLLIYHKYKGQHAPGDSVQKFADPSREFANVATKWAATAEALTAAALLFIFANEHAIPLAEKHGLEAAAYITTALICILGLNVRFCKTDMTDYSEVRKAITEEDTFTTSKNRFKLACYWLAFQLTPVTENLLHIAGVGQLGYTIANILAPKSDKLAIYGAFFLTAIVASFGEYCAQTAADSQWFYDNAVKEFDDPSAASTAGRSTGNNNQPVKHHWHTAPTCLAQAFIYLATIPARIANCFSASDPTKTIYYTIMLSKSLGNAALIAAAPLTLFKLFEGDVSISYENQTDLWWVMATATLAGAALGYLAGVGQTKARYDGIATLAYREALKIDSTKAVETSMTAPSGVESFEAALSSHSIFNRTDSCCPSWGCGGTFRERPSV